MVTKPDAATPLANGPGCANCGAPLQGEYCYACGQPVKGMIRHLSSVLSDVLDTLFNIDSRVIHTVPALYCKPGFLTREYFAGRRVRYVTPFRLMFFLCLAAFFVMQVAVDNANWSAPATKRASAATTGDMYKDAHTPAQVKAVEAQALAQIDRDEANPQLPAVVRPSLLWARQRVQSAAADRITELKRAGNASPIAAGSTAAAKPAPASSGGRTGDDDLPIFSDATWNTRRDPVRVVWLPAFVNGWLNRAGERMHDNVLALKHGATRRAAAQRMVGGMLALLPQTMLVLLPLFALILKVFYLFARRLYMEHLMVALHSHAFIFLSLLILLALAALGALSSSAWLRVPVQVLSAAVWIWLFVYLWLMQKRVYAQSWWLTTVKYGCVGICYSVLLSCGLAIAFILSMAGA